MPATLHQLEPELSEKDKLTVNALVSKASTGLTNAEIAEKYADMSESSFYRWKKQPHVKKAIQQATAEAVADLLPLATRELENLLTDTAASTATRFKCIELVMKLSGLTKPEQQNSKPESTKQGSTDIDALMVQYGIKPKSE